MPSLNLDYMKQYRPCAEFKIIDNQTYPIVNGVIVYHWVDLAVYTNKFVAWAVLFHVIEV